MLNKTKKNIVQNFFFLSLCLYWLQYLLMKNKLLIKISENVKSTLILSTSKDVEQDHFAADSVCLSYGDFEIEIQIARN